MFTGFTEYVVVAFFERNNSEPVAHTASVATTIQHLPIAIMEFHALFWWKLFCIFQQWSDKIWDHFRSRSLQCFFQRKKYSGIWYYKIQPFDCFSDKWLLSAFFEVYYLCVAQKMKILEILNKLFLNWTLAYLDYNPSWMEILASSKKMQYLVCR